ncbi:MAG: type I DNA topoisomerase [Patescibacteria group bacterium]|jgi:DNA topoisomerase-1
MPKLIPKHLVIVESPTKAKTISRFLGKDFDIQSSNGHVRDLPKSKMGIDIEHDFAPQYVIPTKSRKKVTELKKAAKKAAVIYFATDEDREGEAITWHLAQLLDTPSEKVQRITFHEITESAIKDAITHPRKIDQNLVDAQQARRVLDRLMGYELSPFLWKKVAKGLSAGRVQSVALRLIVDREQEIEKFKPQEYWAIEAEFSKINGNKPNITGRLVQQAGKKLDKFSLSQGDEAKKIVAGLETAEYHISRVDKKQAKRSPLPPFTTSTLQQEANRRFGYSSRQTMYFAQQLYEGMQLGSAGSVGLITYMRTDSVNLSVKFLNEAKDYLTKELGNKYALPEPRTFAKKQQLAQEAHEAIRPSDVGRTPESVKEFLEPKLWKTYDLIWRRAVASQMPESVFEQTAVDISTKNGDIFRANGSVIVFDGYQKIYQTNQKDAILPVLADQEKVKLEKLDPQQKFTEPPARYSEAGLVKAMEEYGIGRPSTYAPTISTIVERKYVEKEEKRLKPTEIGQLVNDVLVTHFGNIVDYKFTAHMEEDLDKIAQGEMAWTPVIKEFYEPFKATLAQKEQELSKKDLTESQTDEVCDKCGKPMIIKIGRFGKFLACSGYPDCKNTKQLAKDGQVEVTEAIDEKCPECGKPLQKKVGRFGPFYGCTGYPDCKYIKNIEKKTGVSCPQCHEGEIIEKRSRQGRNFYACNKYPECKFALWSKPTGEKCPECESLLVFGKKGLIACSNKTCKYTKSTDRE